MNLDKQIGSKQYKVMNKEQQQIIDEAYKTRSNMGFNAVYKGDAEEWINDDIDNVSKWKYNPHPDVKVDNVEGFNDGWDCEFLIKLSNGDVISYAHKCAPHKSFYDNQPNRYYEKLTIERTSSPFRKYSTTRSWDHTNSPVGDYIGNYGGIMNGLLTIYEHLEKDIIK